MLLILSPPLGIRKKVYLSGTPFFCVYGDENKKHDIISQSGFCTELVELRAPTEQAK